jgi:hypothetical protein
MRMQGARRAAIAPVAVLLMTGAGIFASAGSASAWSDGDCTWKRDLTRNTGFGNTHVDMRIFLCPDGHNWVEGYLGSNLESEGGVWFDVSLDGGRTWKITQKVTTGGNFTRGTWNAGVGYQYDGPGYWVRACGNWGSTYVYCTAWN